MNEEINFYRNAKKTRSLLLYASVLSILLAIAFLYGIGTFDGVFKIKLSIASGAILLIMLALIFKMLASIKDKSPLIQVDANGFFGRTTPVAKAFGRIEWQDVTDVQLQKVGGDTLVAVTTDNVDKYDGRVSKFLWKMAYDEQNLKLNIMYSASEIEIDADELYKLFLKYWKK
ncbi:MAG: STM3941 family protein [Flavobacterium nitrogenifigens]|uniref:STM3941 family protein n=1 Tax=Flavobacterium nitrogenifigens TaxID=1617283 RepID=UPI00280866C4|nr:STM3941 family protein [Flavobacterium nitrogenifigens]MDQ8014619.1 STM3941 family protein [Flavobacterium nitrogenifigens]